MIKVSLVLVVFAVYALGLVLLLEFIRQGLETFFWGILMVMNP